MSDDYFALNGEFGMWAPIDRGALLNGVCDELLDGANDALDGVQALREADASAVMLVDELMEKYRRMPDDISAIYKEFSSAVLEGDRGLQSLVDHHDRAWRTLQQDSSPKLDHALSMLEEWHGSAANDAKLYLRELITAYSQVESKITLLEAEVVAARESVASARHDLNNLGHSLKEAAEHYKKEKEAQQHNLMTKVLAGAFAAAVTGLLGTVTLGAGAAAVAVEFSVARGALIAADVAGSAIAAKMSGEVSGEHGWDLFDSFTSAVDNIRTELERTAGDLASDIHHKAEYLPKVPPPPDVSPGDHFDPDDFETDRTSHDTEQNVRDSDVDIAPDGSASTTNSDIPGRLDG